MKAIKSDLDLSTRQLKKMKVYKCQNASFYKVILGFLKISQEKFIQMFMGNIIGILVKLDSFYEKGITPSHGILFSKLKKYIKIKNYAEFNSPFMGLMMDFFSLEYKKIFFKIFYEYIKLSFF